MVLPPHLQKVGRDHGGKGPGSLNPFITAIINETPNITSVCLHRITTIAQQNSAVDTPVAQQNSVVWVVASNVFSIV